MQVVNGFLKILIVFAVVFLTILPTYPIIYSMLFLYQNISQNLFFFMSPLLLIISYVCYILFFIVETKIILMIFKTKKIEGTFKLNKINKTLIYFSITNAFNTMLKKLLSKLLLNSSILSEALFTVYGAKKGKGCMIGADISDPHLIEMGNNCVVGKNSIIVGHFIIGNKIFIKKVKIGNNVTIGANTIIGPGVIIENNVLVKINSFVKPNKILKKNSVYSGNPAKFEKKINKEFIV